MAEVRAQLNNLRMAPRKVRAVANLIKGKKVTDAGDQLSYYIKKPVAPLKKLLSSAVANAENNFNMVKDNLYIKELIVNEGIKLKRFKAKGFGRAAAIQKKTSHIMMVLGELTPGLRQDKKTRDKQKESQEQSPASTADRNTKKSNTDESRQSKPEIKREIGSKKGFLGGIGKKMFQRKSV